MNIKTRKVILTSIAICIWGKISSPRTCSSPLILNFVGPGRPIENLSDLFAEELVYRLPDLFMRRGTQQILLDRTIPINVTLTGSPKVFDCLPVKAEDVLQILKNGGIIFGQKLEKLELNQNATSRDAVKALNAYSASTKYQESDISSMDNEALDSCIKAWLERNWAKITSFPITKMGRSGLSTENTILEMKMSENINMQMNLKRIEVLTPDVFISLLEQAPCVHKIVFYRDGKEFLRYTDAGFQYTMDPDMIGCTKSEKKRVLFHFLTHVAPHMV